MQSISKTIVQFPVQIKGLKTDLAFQVKCINIAARNNFLINLLQWVFFRLIRKNLVSNLLDLDLKILGMILRATI